MAYGTKFATQDIQRQKVDLYVNGNGTFNATVNGSDFEAKTVELLVAQVTKFLKTEFKPIPFHRWEDGKLKAGTITGVHTRTKHLLVKLGGKTSQEYSYSNTRYLRLTSSEQEEYTTLKLAEEAAEKASVAFEVAHNFYPKDEIEEM